MIVNASIHHIKAVAKLAQGQHMYQMYQVSNCGSLFVNRLTTCILGTRYPA